MPETQAARPVHLLLAERGSAEGGVSQNLPFPFEQGVHEEQCACETMEERGISHFETTSKCDCADNHRQFRPDVVCCDRELRLNGEWSSEGKRQACKAIARSPGASRGFAFLEHGLEPDRKLG